MIMRLLYGLAVLAITWAVQANGRVSGIADLWAKVARAYFCQRVICIWLHLPARVLSKRACQRLCGIFVGTLIYTGRSVSLTV